MIDTVPEAREQFSVDQLLFKHVEWTGFVYLVATLSIFNLLLLAMPLPVDARSVVLIFNFAIGIILWADFFYLLRKSPDKRRFMKEERGWMVLIGNLPAFSILRLLWFRWILRAHGRKPRDFVSEIAFNHNASATVLSVLFAVLVVFELSVVMILFFEEPTDGGNIKSISDGFWWAFVTIATVGYGDRFPVTNGGRVIGVMLMLVGIALFSVATSGLAGWFRSRPMRARLEVKHDHQDELPKHMTELKELLQAQEANYRTMLEAHEEGYQQRMAELHARLNALEVNGKGVAPAKKGQNETNEKVE